VTQKLDEIWREKEGCVILFNWLSFLKEESLAFLGIGDEGIDISEIIGEDDLQKNSAQNEEAKLAVG